MVEGQPISQPEAAPRTSHRQVPVGLWAEVPTGLGVVAASFPVGNLIVRQIVSPFLAENCYLIEHIQKRCALAIDPGFGSALAISDALQASGCKLERIILTHEHIDHIANLNELRRLHPCSVVASRDCSERITDGKKNLSVFHLNVCYESAGADLVLMSPIEPLPWSDTLITLYAAPGHTSGGLCAYLPGMLFSGDTLIWKEKTVVKLPGGDRVKLRTTLDWIFSTFPESTRVFGGHGQSFLLSETRLSTHLH